MTLLNDIEKVRDTILHEIAHALVGFNHYHDWIWKQKALEIGCNGNRCYNSKEVAIVVGNYVAICPNGHKKYRFKKLKAGRKVSCGQCSRSFNPDAILVYEPVKK